MIAMLCLISSTFLLGYSAGAAVPVPQPGWISRTLGALIAGANGALLLSFALRDIRVYLLSAQDSDFLDSAVIAPFLSEGTGWVLLFSAAIFVPIALVVALFGPQIEYDDYYETGEYDTYDEDVFHPYAEHSMPVSSSRREFRAAEEGQIPNPAEETRPIPASDVRDEPVGQSESSEEETTDEQRELVTQTHPSGDAASHPTEVESRERPSRCPNCHADIRGADVYCLSCGRMI